jgi:hypothetical protein
MRPERRHSGKFVQQLSRQGIHIGIKIAPNNVGLVPYIKIRLEEIEVHAAKHCKEQRLSEIFKEIVGFESFTSRQKIE